MKLKKIPFFKDCIDCFHHVIQPGRLSISTKVTYTIQGVQHTSDLSEQKS